MRVLPVKREFVKTNASLHGWGAVFETPEIEGYVAQHATAHQHSQDEGSMASAATFSTSVKGQTCPYKNRQYHSGVLYHPPRGDKISEPVKIGTKALEMGGCPSPLSESHVSSWSLQSNSGLSVSGHSHILGLTYSQGSDSVNLAHLWQGRGGLICRQADNSLSNVVFRQGRATGSRPGCIGTQLAKILVCISTPTITMDDVGTISFFFHTTEKKLSIYLHTHNV